MLSSLWAGGHAAAKRPQRPRSGRSERSEPTCEPEASKVQDSKPHRTQTKNLTEHILKIDTEPILKIDTEHRLKIDTEHRLKMNTEHRLKIGT